MAIARRLKSTTEQPKIHHRRGKYTTLRLIQPYLGNGHTLFVDNYYTSQILFHDLYQQQTGACGTMSVNPRAGEQIQRPACIVDYDKYMGAVDRCDQMIAYPAFKGRTLKWWKKVFYHLLMMATLNAYLLYKENCAKWRKKPVLHQLFRREIVKALVGETSHQPVVVRGPVNQRDMELGATSCLRSHKKVRSLNL